MKMIMVRHGSTIINANEVVQPTGNVLSEIGISQAEAVSMKLEGYYNFDRIVTSPLQRVVDTANMINDKFEKKLVINNYLTEVKLPTALDGISVADPKVVEYRHL